MSNFKGVTYLSEEQYNELSTKGTLTVGGKTYTYDKTGRIYITNKLPDEVVIDSELSEISTNPVQNKVVKQALDGKASLSEQNNFIASNTFESETNFNKNVLIENSELLISNADVKIMDSANDIVTRYKAGIIEIEENNVPNSYMLVLPRQSDTLATLSDLPKAIS